MKALSVLLVESSPLFGRALARVLSRVSISATLTGSTASMGDTHRKFDAVLIDVATFPGGDEQLAELVQAHLKSGPILLLAREDRIDQIITGLRAGAIAVLRQTASERDLRMAVNAVAGGFAWCDRQMFQRLTRYLLPLNQWHEPRLTNREREVLQCVGRGQTNKEIALCLGLSEQSVKVYVSNLLRKVGVPNRSSLAMHALAAGIESAEP